MDEINKLEIKIERKREDAFELADLLAICENELDCMKHDLVVLKRIEGDKKRDEGSLSMRIGC